jgi:pyrimidine operon attenuation protein/uracil phosphoribosyltransferase
MTRLASTGNTIDLSGIDDHTVRNLELVQAGGVTQTPQGDIIIIINQTAWMPDGRTIISDQDAVERALSRMAREIVEQNSGTERLILLGIQRRGVELARRIREIIESDGRRIPTGSLDITLYRDDLGAVGPVPLVGESHLPIEGVDDKTVVVIDDVLFTGRTARAAMNELMDWGRPSRILLCVLVDRGGRELPIQPDIVGRRVSILPRQTVEVRVPELDGRLSVDLSFQPREGA